MILPGLDRPDRLLAEQAVEILDGIPVLGSLAAAAHLKNRITCEECRETFSNKKK